MRKHRLLACMMAVIMAVCLIPSTALAVAPPQTANPTPVDKTYSNVVLGKKATPFNSKYQTDITLTVTPQRFSKPVAVEFVLDATSSLFSTGDAILIESWAKDIQATMADKNVYVGLTIFGTAGKTLYPVTSGELTSESTFPYDIKTDSTWLSEQILWLNSHYGTNVQAGIRAGKADLDTLPTDITERYMVLLTDGGSYFHLDENGDPVGTYNEAADYLKANPTYPIGNLSDLKNDPDRAPTSFERSVAKSALELNTLGGIKLITVGIPYYKDTLYLKPLTDLAAEFITDAKGHSVYFQFLNSKEEVVAKSVVSGIAGSIGTIVPKGSVITDVIGYNSNSSLGDIYNLDVVKDAVFTLTVNGTAMTGTLKNNQITFDDGSVLTYSDTGEETFRLVLGQDVKTSMTLTYTAKLTNPISSGVHFVYTNDSATLDTTPGGVPAEPIEFPMPSLKYGSSGNGGYTPPPLLNTEDHFGYIIGYPVDYYTGEKTDDQTKMPVKPQGQITRAEVATIFFRMLTDEARNEYWSQTSSYTDVKITDWFNNAICTLSNAGIISGYPDGSFKPNGKITRAEFATIASRFFDIEVSGVDAFPDISGHWAEQYINEAAAAGIINGYEDGTFRPQKLITRAEAMTMVNRTLGRAPEKDHLLYDMLKWPDNMDTTQWYYAQVQEATNSHEYNMATAFDGTKYEIWTELLPVRDWEAFEKEWSDSNSSENPGEVV